MDIIFILKAAILGIVEGLTEFLPISSTGHLILAGALLDFHGDTAKVFDIAIQTGAMLAVLWEYRTRFSQTLRGIASEPVAQRFTRNVLLAFIPAVIFGLALGGLIKHYLFYPVPVAVALIIGGFIILWIERRHRRLYGDMDLQGARKARIQTVDDMNAADALKLGLIQCLALIPGTSRSGATIMGALVMGFSRKAAAEFSFFLGVPTLIGAGVYSVYKDYALLRVQDLPLFAVGIFFSAISAWLCIRWLIRYVSTHDFTVFAWYRIVFGLGVLVTAHFNWIQWMPT